MAHLNAQEKEEEDEQAQAAKEEKTLESKEQEIVKRLVYLDGTCRTESCTSLSSLMGNVKRFSSSVMA